jgi:hypothetical protein
MGFQIVKLTDPIQFTNVAGGLVPKGAYNAGTDYAVGDSVDYNGSSYVMHTDAGAGTVPTNTTYWQVLANKGDTGATGATGSAGANGTNGTNGAGVVTGGTAGQVLSKIDGTDYNTQWSTADKTFVGLGNVDNTSDANKPVSTATQTALDGKFTQRTITGTADQVTVTNGDGVSGNPTLSLPQNIHTGASPTFAGLAVTANTNPTIVNITTSTTALTAFEAQLQLTSGATNSRFFYRDSDKNFGFYVNGTTRIRVIGGTGDIQFTGHTYPSADSTYTLGTSSLYWSNTYTDRLYLNSTAYIDGASAGTSNFTGSLGILATSGAATHSLTLGSTATGIALYNTADQTTNFERVLASWNSNIFTISTGAGGSGTNRAIEIGTTTNKLYIQNSETANGSYQMNRAISSSGSVVLRLYSTMTQSSGIGTLASLTPTINQTSTAGYTALLINPTETTTGSGTKLLADFQVGGTSLAFVNNQGDISSEGIQSFDRQPAGNVSIPANNSAVVVGRYSIASGRTLTIGSGAVLAIIN